MIIKKIQKTTKKIGIMIILITIIINIGLKLKEQEEKQEEKIIMNEIIEPKKEKNDNPKAILEIPKIKLKKPLYKEKQKNDIEKNIKVLTNLNPKTNTIILAAHSGNSKVSFFKSIYKLEINDSVNIIYQNKKYYYIVIKKYEIDKTGTMEKPQNENNLLILTTCSYNQNKQLIIITKQKKIQNMNY